MVRVANLEGCEVLVVDCDREKPCMGFPPVFDRDPHGLHILVRQAQAEDLPGLSVGKDRHSDPEEPALTGLGPLVVRRGIGRLRGK
jgi:hypothetical protein